MQHPPCLLQSVTSNSGNHSHKWDHVHPLCGRWDCPSCRPKPGTHADGVHNSGLPVSWLHVQSPETGVNPTDHNRIFRPGMELHTGYDMHTQEEAPEAQADALQLPPSVFPHSSHNLTPGGTISVSSRGPQDGNSDCQTTPQTPEGCTSPEEGLGLPNPHFTRSKADSNHSIGASEQLQWHLIPGTQSGCCDDNRCLREGIWHPAGICQTGDDRTPEIWGALDTRTPSRVSAQGPQPADTTELDEVRRRPSNSTHPYPDPGSNSNICGPEELQLRQKTAWQDPVGSDRQHCKCILSGQTRGDKNRPIVPCGRSHGEICREVQDQTLCGTHPRSDQQCRLREQKRLGQERLDASSPTLPIVGEALGTSPSRCICNSLKCTTTQVLELGPREHSRVHRCNEASVDTPQPVHQSTLAAVACNHNKDTERAGNSNSAGTSLANTILVPSGHQTTGGHPSAPGQGTTAGGTTLLQSTTSFSTACRSEIERTRLEKLGVEPAFAELLAAGGQPKTKRLKDGQFERVNLWCRQNGIDPHEERIRAITSYVISHLQSGAFNHQTAIKYIRTWCDTW